MGKNHNVKEHVNPKPIPNGTLCRIVCNDKEHSLYERNHYTCKTDLNRKLGDKYFYCISIIGSSEKISWVNEDYLVTFESAKLTWFEKLKNKLRKWLKIYLQKNG